MLALSDEEVEALAYACGPGMEQCKKDFKKTNNRQYSIRLITLDRLKADLGKLIKKEN
ncbi:hypothetical protein GTN66_04100, partial [bacterium]|nr:hypothetical protein [bacterium]NIO73584.1 hypothetical protein [bacterium]